MSRKAVTGVCAICGKQGKLSYEHVPPEKAFNKATVIEYTFEDWVVKRKHRGRYRQGGVGQHTLCEECNNNTGSWYADEYIKWARIAHDILVTVRRDPEQLQGQTRYWTILNNVYPLRFLKQVVTCFFSVISGGQNATFAKNEPQLVKFVLDKHETALPEQYRFGLFLYPFASLRRFPIAGKISVSHTSTGQVKALSANGFSEISHPPFGLVMTHNSEVFAGATDITGFAAYGYDDKADLPLYLTLGQQSGPLPGNY